MQRKYQRRTKKIKTKSKSKRLGLKRKHHTRRTRHKSVGTRKKTYKPYRKRAKKRAGGGILVETDVFEAIAKLKTYCNQKSMPKNVYKKLATVLHPDKTVHLSKPIRHQASDAFKMLNDAYSDGNFTECSKLYVTPTIQTNASKPQSRPMSGTTAPNTSNTSTRKKRPAFMTSTRPRQSQRPIPEPYQRPSRNESHQPSPPSPPSWQAPSWQPPVSQPANDNIHIIPKTGRPTRLW
jgi:hypothetical protein